MRWCATPPDRGRVTRAGLLVILLTVLAVGCSGNAGDGDAVPSTAATTTTTTAPPTSTTATSTTTTVPAGIATVDVAGSAISFELSRCTLEPDLLWVEGRSADGRGLLIRHASPSTPDPPEPSMGELEVTPGFVSYPAGVSFTNYDPPAAAAAGVAFGSSDPFSTDDTEVAFSISCS